MGILHRLVGSRARAIWRVEAKLLNRLGYVQAPVAVQWISTSMCDLTCPHCYSQAGKKTVGELSTIEAKTLLIDELVKLNRPTLVIAGGETLLRQDFPDLVAYAHRRGVPWAIHTHGGRVEAFADVFTKYRPVMAAISVDGPRAYHDDFRGKAGSFDAALRAIAVLKQAGVPEVVAGTTINRHNADLLADMAPDILASAADSWGFHLMTPEGRAGEHRELMPTMRQLRRAAGFARRMRAIFHVELDNEWGSGGHDDCFYRDSTFTCGAGRISCVVSATGEVMPCTTTDANESQGNIRDRALHDIWARGFTPFRTPGHGIASDCDDCWLNTRHGVSCRPAFDIDLLEPDGRRRIPLFQLNTTGVRS